MKTLNDADKLKEFMEQHFDFTSLKKAGVFPKEIKSSDFDGQAKIICRIFGLESVYEYAFIGRGQYAHISYVHPTPFTRFVEPIGEPLMKIEGKTAKIISIDIKP